MIGIGIWLALAAALPPAHAIMSEQEKSGLYKMASAMDALGLEKPRKLLDGGYISPFGLQFHPSCFRISKGEKIDRDLVEARLEAVALSTFKKLVVDCRQKYPELTPWIRSWISQFRRTVISCSNKTQKELGYGAMNTANGWNIASQLDKDERSGIDTTGPFDSLANANKPVIVYPRDVFLFNANAKEPSADLERILMHEVFHTTTLNNRGDHNDIETVPVGKNGKCGDDISEDRINFVTELCTGFPLKGTKKPASAVLFEKMSQCGSNKCESLFTSKIEPASLWSAIKASYTPSAGIPPSEAKMLCARIYDDGACHYDLETQGETITATKIPQLNEMGDRLRNRLYELFPHNPVQISAEAAKAFREPVQGIRTSASPECFATVFRTDIVGDALYVKDAAPYDKNNDAKTSGDPTPSKEAYHALSEAAARVLKSDKCSQSDKKNLYTAIVKLQDAYDYVFESYSYQRMAKPRYLHQAESHFDPYGIAPRDQAFATMLGQGLYDEYLAMLKRFHYTSPDFDCAAANLRPLRVLSMFQKSAQNNATNLACIGEKK